MLKTGKWNKPKVLHVNAKNFGSFNDIVDIIKGTDAAPGTSVQKDVMNFRDGVTRTVRNNNDWCRSIRDLVHDTRIKDVPDALAEEAEQRSVAENLSPIIGHETNLLIVKLG